VARYAALGNDFLLVDGPIPEADECRNLCDRRAGVGADGVIALEGATATLRNADGSPAGFSGNGVRAAGWHQAPEGGDVEVTLGERRHAMQVLVQDEGHAVVTLAVPDPALHLAPWERDEVALALPGCLEAWEVDVGNPHLVLWADADAPAPEEVLDALRREAPGHPGGVNVTWLQAEAPGRARARTWERGVGPTPACASASMACALVLRERGDESDEVVLQLPGGSLTLAGSRRELRLSSPVRRILSGWWYP
jgi:diaminopimelate epimerase